MAARCSDCRQESTELQACKNTRCTKKICPDCVWHIMQLQGEGRAIACERCATLIYNEAETKGKVIALRVVKSNAR